VLVGHVYPLDLAAVPFDRTKYPPDWRTISVSIRNRSGGRCECLGCCGDPHRDGWTIQYAGRCRAMNGHLHPVTGSRVVLTVAHLCRCRDAEGKKCGDPTHLLALCQRCHLALDRADHIAHARSNRHARRAAADLFPEYR
jgi:hypothetical protein